MKKQNMKKGISLLEILIAIVLIAVIAAMLFKFLSGKKEEIVYKNSLDTFLQSFHEGMLKYSTEAVAANENFVGATATSVIPFMNSNIIVLSGSVLTPKVGNLNGLLEVTVNPARDANANNNRRYKTMFDITKLSSANSWTAEQRQKAENEIAKFFSNVTPDGLIISGGAVSLPAATTDATASAANDDGIIVLDRIK